jgi:hypothetical protein
MRQADDITDQFILFSPPKDQATKAGLVFFPGAKVQEEAYAPLAEELAQIGVAVALVRAPLDLPFLLALRPQRVEGAIRAVQADNEDLPLIFGGHSAGGFVASRWKDDRMDELLLVCSRSQGKPRPEVSGLAIFGDQDGFVDAQERLTTQQTLPGLVQKVVRDLDHDFAQGLYGPQPGDPEISGDASGLAKTVARLVDTELLLA